MSRANRIARVLVTAAVAVAIGGCDQEQPKPTAASAPTPAATSAPATSAPAASATAATPSASATVTPHDCPPGSTGEGSLNKPCEAKGRARAMEVTWTGKITDTGPSFRVLNKAPAPILYGWIVVYFYDKAGKQLEVKDPSGKMHPYHRCTGNLFSGVMKVAEKAVLTFSCVKKDVVPEGTAQIEAEMQTVGFADATEKKSEYFWRNSELTPDARPKGGVK